MNGYFPEELLAPLLHLQVFRRLGLDGQRVVRALVLRHRPVAAKAIILAAPVTARAITLAAPVAARAITLAARRLYLQGLVEQRYGYVPITSVVD